MSDVQLALESILIADCGSSTTKVVLLDVVEGQYRFIAYAQSISTVKQPWRDVSAGVIDAIRQLEQTTGRTFLDRNNQLVTPEYGDGRGIDRFLATSSAAEPLRVVLAGLVRDVSLASARRAALSTYTDLVDIISLEQAPDQNEPRAQDDQINAILRELPDAICIAGGTDGGATTPVLTIARDIIRVALYLMGDAAPPIVYAGNARLGKQIAKLFDGLTQVQIVDNVRPLPNAENIAPAHEELELLFYDLKMSALPGIQTLTAWTPAIVLPTARASDYVVRFCERVWQSSKPALSVDVGSSTVTLNVCQDGHPLTTVRTDIGIGYGLTGLLHQVDLDAILRWLPFELSRPEAYDRLMNKTLRPGSIPQTRQDLLLIQAAAREAIRVALDDSLPGWPQRSDGREGMIPACDPIIAGGRLLTQAPDHGYAALILLDALQPLGVSALYLDEHNLLPALGVAGVVEPMILVQALRNDGLTFLGVVVAPAGYAKPGDTALTVKSADKTSDLRVEVKFGDVQIIPLETVAPGSKLQLLPASGLDIGQGKGKSQTIECPGGAVGLIVDARGRPLALDEDEQTRRQQLDRWLEQMTTV